MIAQLSIALILVAAGVIQCFRARSEIGLGVGWSLLLSAALLAICAMAPSGMR